MRPLPFLPRRNGGRSGLCHGNSHMKIPAEDPGISRIHGDEVSHRPLRSEKTTGRELVYHISSSTSFEHMVVLFWYTSLVDHISSNKPVVKEVSTNPDSNPSIHQPVGKGHSCHVWCHDQDEHDEKRLSAIRQSEKSHFTSDMFFFRNGLGWGWFIAQAWYMSNVTYLSFDMEQTKHINTWNQNMMSHWKLWPFQTFVSSITPGLCETLSMFPRSASPSLRRWNFKTKPFKNLKKPRNHSIKTWYAGVNSLEIIAMLMLCCIPLYAIISLPFYTIVTIVYHYIYIISMFSWSDSNW